MNRFAPPICIVLLGTTLLTVAPSSAQLRPESELNVVLGMPKGEFGDRAGTGVGLNLFVGARPQNSPIAFGAKLGYMIYGIERRSEPFSTTIPDVTVDVETRNNIVLGHLVLRLQMPGNGPFVPYVNGLFGFKYLFTETSIESNRTSEDVATSTNFDDTALSYGGGGGLKIRVFEGAKRTFFVNLAVDYLIGKKAEYLTKGSIRREGGEVTFDVEESDTNILIPRLGVAVSL
jgi:hypothetical protein